MNTPVADFVRAYAAARPARLHMPGHKGTGPLGCESLDITEVQGADALCQPSGIIAESEANASSLFGSQRTFYAAEGSSQCVRAMLALAVWRYGERFPGVRPVVAAARNVHKSFLYTAALLDFDVVWLWPEGPMTSLCACGLSPEALEADLAALPRPPAAVYLTSPDYLGGQCDISALGQIARRHGAPLLVDNAHGAYLRFLSPSRHPLDLGADLCCDSAHKTLPVLTGGAYLHVGRRGPEDFAREGRRALSLFGSTSPSYLILQSLDLCNQYLAGDYPRRLAETAKNLDQARRRLRERGWTLWDTDPLKVTVDCAASGWTGPELDRLLQSRKIICEYRDRDDLVLMFTPENPSEDLRRLLDALGENRRPPLPRPPLPQARGQAVCSIREAMLLLPHETVPASQALGRVCGAPAVGCPPAIPVAAAGERIGPEALALFDHYRIPSVEVCREPGGRV